MKDKAKLKLKHLAPYLPYGLKMEVLKETIETLYKLSSDTNYATINGFVDINAIKPLLRPLSDLIKEIVHNGEKIVFMEMFDNEIQKKINLVLGGNLKYVVTLPYYVVNELFEKHFDVFGLIEKNLAISVHDLDN